MTFEGDLRARVVARLLIGILSVSLCQCQYSLAGTGDVHGRRASTFEPPVGKTILFIGQTKGEIEDYAHAGVGDPPGYMLYTNLERLEGLSEPFLGSGCMDAGVQDLSGLAQEFPGSAAQIGLNIESQVPSINSGQMDDQIRKLATRLRDVRRPVFLRIGYEFDGPWNGYEPEGYRLAFRRIVSIFRGRRIGRQRIHQIQNVAFVWHSAAWKTYGNHPLSAWYPGDRYVDWIGVSWFGLGGDEANTISENARAAVLFFARRHGKPLMIAESTPRKYFPPEQAESWVRWYSPIFRWIVENDIKGFSYINQNWEVQQMWGNPDCKSEMDWGESRVQVQGSAVLTPWRKEITSPRFLKPGEQLFRSIGFQPFIAK
jgi:hypothetical protein